VEYLVQQGKKLGPRVYPVPEELDKEVGRLKLKAMGVSIDSLTREQKQYTQSWELGT
jgi:adenosylhomocysteinase